MQTDTFVDNRHTVQVGMQTLTNAGRCGVTNSIDTVTSSHTYTGSGWTVTGNHSGAIFS